MSMDQGTNGSTDVNTVTIGFGPSQKRELEFDNGRVRQREVLILELEEGRRNIEITMEDGTALDFEVAEVCDGEDEFSVVEIKLRRKLFNNYDYTYRWEGDAQGTTFNPKTTTSVYNNGDDVEANRRNC